MDTNKEGKVLLNVEGMTCSNCALGISKYLERLGLEDVSVNFSTAEVKFRTEKVENLDSIIKGIENLGYKVVDTGEASRQHGMSNVEKKFIFTIPFTLLLFVSMFLPWPWLHDPYIQLGLCIPVYIIGMWHFGKSAWSSLKTGVPNMDVLITIGATAAFIYSLIGTIEALGHNYMFYETAATIITLVLLGNVIEHRSVKQTTTAIKELHQLQPQQAKLVVPDEDTGQDRILEVDADTLTAGDIIHANTGDKIPADAIIISGNASMDEAMITGESMPVEKQQQEQLIGGTIVVNGAVKAKVTATGEDTVLSQIINLVKEAQTDKPPIQRLADRISAIFVPVVLAIAVLTVLIGYFFFDLTLANALMNSIAVLVIACPCAMGLATPTAVMVGIGRSAKNGILIKGGATVEMLSKVKNIVFDKTGTLTTGKFSIREIKILEGTEEEAKDILYNLERNSGHPIAKAITEHFKEAKEMALQDIEEIKGVGIKAKDASGNEYMAGSYRIAEALTKEAEHNIYLVKNGKLIAWLDIEDTLKPEAKEVIQQLNQRGYNTILLSGDSNSKVASVANELGIKEYHGEQMPEQKLTKIGELSAAAPTAMVGDGINDAPALTKADVGISLSNATQIAVQSAEVVLLNGNLNYLVQAMDLGKHTVLTIKQNLFWAFFYNVLAIPIAAAGYLRPMIAALAMAFSDVIVIGNSIRLKYKKVSHKK